MPGGGPVYQPTTVSYEPQSQWASPAGFLAQNGPVGRARYLQYIALVIGLIGIASGLVMIIEGSVDLEDTEVHDASQGHTTPVEEAHSQKDVTVVIIGALLLCMGLAFVIFYLMIAFRRRGCPCFMSKEQRMARGLRSPHGANGHGMNPSTDLLVAAQYAPVSEIAYHPPVAEEEETRKLMAADNKDCIKDSDSIPSLNEERFEPPESPAPRRLRNYPPIAAQLPLQPPITIDLGPKCRTSDDEQPTTDVLLESQPTTTTTPRTQPIEEESRPAGEKSWRQVIQRKASTRSRRAPLAGGEEITPSLTSSYNSLYFNDNNFSDDDDDDEEEVNSD